jgi:hypothetical protein
LIPSTAQARSSHASTNADPLSTLCRRRHNGDYADLGVMPNPACGACSPGVSGLKLSA